MIDEYKNLRSIVDLLRREAPNLDDIGLYHGKMGIVIFFFEYARKTGSALYEDLGMDLLNSILDQIDHSTSVTYSNGLSGIGAGVIFLLKEGFLEGNADYILSEIDSKICSVIHYRNLSNLSLDTGICGLGKYLVARIITSETIESFSTIKNKEHLIYLVDWIESVITKDDKYLADVLALMVDIRKTNIHKQKTECLISYCSTYLFGDNIGLKSGVTGLGMSLTNTYKLW